MLVRIVAFLSGIIITLQCRDLPGAEWAYLLPLLALLAIQKRLVLAVPAALLCGFLYTLMVADGILANSLDEHFEGKDLQVTGTIASLPEQKDKQLRFMFDVESVTLNHQSIQGPGKIRLSWYGRNIPDLRAGERWLLNVRLKRPHGFSNPGGFDYEAWLFQQGIRATGYVRGKQVNQKLADAGLHLHNIRQAIRDRLTRLANDQESIGILLALAIGDRSRISATQWQAFNATGTNHLVAISGLHISLVAGIAFFLMRRLWCFFPRLILLYPAPHAAVIAALIAALIYAALAGFALPTQRAVVMLAVLAAGKLFGWRLSAFQILAVALFVVLLLDPLGVMSPGFWLSFIAVATIFYTMQGRWNASGWWWRWGRVQWTITLLMAPVLILFFGKLSLISPLANALAIPIVGLVVVPLTLLAVVTIFWSSLSALLLVVAGFVMHHTANLLIVMEGWSFSQWQFTGNSFWTIVVATLAVAWMLLPRGMPNRWLGVIGILPLVLVSSYPVEEDKFLFTLLDVGQGLSAVIQTKHHVVVYDVGPKFSADFDTGEAVVLPFLRQQGRDKIDVLLVSHADNDHAGGLRSVATGIAVDRFLSIEPQLSPTLKGELCQAGQHWTFDGVLFEIIHPSLDWPVRKRNNGSCVLRVSVGDHRVLLPGDIEKKAERFLNSSHNDLLRADVMVVPHHGSKTSSSQGFIQAVQPRYALLPVGYRNRYRLPNAQILARYKENRISTRSTADHGAITLQVSKAGVSSPALHREQEKRFWHN